MMIKKIGMALSIAQFTYQIIKDLAKFQNPKTHSIAERKAKKDLEAMGYKVAAHPIKKHVGKAVKQQQMRAKRKAKSEQKDD